MVNLSSIRGVALQGFQGGILSKNIVTLAGKGFQLWRSQITERIPTKTFQPLLLSHLPETPIDPKHY